MLGSLSEADDAVQEAWLRLSRSESCTIENLDGWRWEQPEKADQTRAACCRSPVYSPDGTEILFPGYRLSNTFDHLFEMNPDGSNVSLFSDCTNVGVHPDWGAKTEQ